MESPTPIPAKSPTPIIPATITLADGKERTLLYSHAACKAIKNEFGVSVMMEGTAKVFQAIDEEKLLRLLQLGIDHEFGGEPGITEAQLGKILTAQNRMQAMLQIDIAFGQSLVKNALAVMMLTPYSEELRNLIAAAIVKVENKLTPPAPEPVPEPTTPVTVM